MRLKRLLRRTLTQFAVLCGLAMLNRGVASSAHVRLVQNTWPVQHLHRDTRTELPNRLFHRPDCAVLSLAAIAVMPVRHLSGRLPAVKRTAFPTPAATRI